jgi:plastocyanin
VLVLLAGFGGVLAGAGDAGAAGTVAVAITDAGFDPPSVRIGPGDTVRWTNTGSRPHAVASATGDFASETLAPGDLYLWTFDAAGAYEVGSPLDPGMRAEVVVGTPAAGPPGQSSAAAGPVPGSPTAPGATGAAAKAPTTPLPFTGADESIGLALLGSALLLLGWAGWTSGIPPRRAPWTALTLVGARGPHAHDERLPHGRWRRRPRRSAHESLLPGRG